MSGARELRVRWFASLADRTGASTERAPVSAGATVRELWDAMERRHPGLGDLSFRPLVALDLDWAEWDAPLDGVEEVAFLPPVSGG